MIRRIRPTWSAPSDIIVVIDFVRYFLETNAAYKTPTNIAKFLLPMKETNGISFPAANGTKLPRRIRIIGTNRIDRAFNAPILSFPVVSPIDAASSSKSSNV